MKNIIGVIAIVFSFGIFNVLQAQNSEDGKTMVLKFKVEGVCGMCKERIEEAAFIKGVKYAQWDRKTGILEVVYRTDKTTEMDIHNSIAKAGHSTEKVKAKPEDYKKLPECCQYNEVAPH
jgi:hypothetical protein